MKLELYLANIEPVLTQDGEQTFSLTFTSGLLRVNELVGVVGELRGQSVVVEVVHAKEEE